TAADGRRVNARRDPLRLVEGCDRPHRRAEEGRRVGKPGLRGLLRRGCLNASGESGAPANLGGLAAQGVREPRCDSCSGPQRVPGGGGRVFRNDVWGGFEIPRGGSSAPRTGDLVEEVPNDYTAR